MALDAEVENGYLYEILAFGDEDGRLVGYCDVPVSWDVINAQLVLVAFAIGE